MGIEGSLVVAAASLASLSASSLPGILLRPGARRKFVEVILSCASLGTYVQLL